MTVLVDVREASEFELGHVPGAINLPASTSNVRDYLRFAKADIVLQCATGVRAAQVLAKLQRAGYSQARLSPVRLQDVQAMSIAEKSTKRLPNVPEVIVLVALVLALLVIVVGSL